MYEPLWERPEAIRDVESILASAPGRARVIAGGTDLAILIRRGEVRPEILVDLGRVAGMSQIEVGPDEGRAEIGALVTHARVADDRAIRARASALAQACRTVGSRQIRSRGTIGGNIANASPAADGAVALLAFDAAAEVRGGDTPGGGRRVPLRELFEGPGKVALAPSELVTAFTFKLPGVDAKSVYLKVGQRKALAIAIASAAVIFEPSAGRIRIALGSVAPTPVRATAAERFFEAELPRSGTSGALMDKVADLAVEAASTIDDVRASAWYRADLVRTLTRRALGSLCD